MRAGSRVIASPILLAGALALLTLSCGDRRPEPPPAQNAALGGEVAARVATEPMPLSLVRNIALAQHLPPRDALNRAIDDAVLAGAARDKGLDRRPSTAWRLVSLRARMTSDRLFEEAKLRGPPDDEEVRAISERHWAEVDRPPSVRVIHAIVLRPQDPALLAEASSLAGKMRAALLPTTTPEEFEREGKAVPHGPKLEIRVERLPAFVEDGRVWEGGGGMDEKFARAAHALGAPGAMTGLVETSFGWHVIRLIERLPEQRMPFEERRIAFVDEANAFRARDLLQSTLERLKAQNPVTLSPAAESLMRAVPIQSAQATLP